MRTVEQPLSLRPSCGEGILRRRVFVAEHARDESNDRIDQRHRGNLATAEHKIPDAQFKGLQFVNDALVNSFVMPGDQEQPGTPGV